MFGVELVIRLLKIKILALPLFIVCFCIANFALAEDAHVDESKSKKIKLGAIVPLSGPLAFFGNDYVRAYDLLKSDFPEIEKIIDIHWEDSAYDGKLALSAFNKLVAVNQVDIVFSFGGPMLNVLAPIAELKRVPFFATESEKRDCEGRDYCSLFRNEEDEWGQATWRMLRKQGKKNIGIVKNQNQFMNTFVNAIVRNKNDDESVELFLDIPPEMVDLRTSVLPLKSKNFDAVGVYLLPTSHHGFLEALRSLNKQFTLFGVEEFLVEENNKGFENLIEGTLVIAPHATKHYRAKFESNYGHSAGFYYTPAFYDFMVLLKDTIAKDGGLRGLDLVNEMHFKGEREGVSGKFSVKISGEGVYSYSFPISVYKVSRPRVVIQDVITFQ